MARIENNTIILEVLQSAASTGVLGETKQLRVAAPCAHSNARGDLREVESFTHLAAAATSSAKGFLAAFAES